MRMTKELFIQNYREDRTKISDESFRHFTHEIFNDKDFHTYWVKKTNFNIQETKDKVAQHLPENTELLTWGIAGGAVANVFFAYLTGEEPVVNDLDIFAWVQTEEESKQRYFAGDDKFLKVERDGIYNIIYKTEKNLFRNSHLDKKYLNKSFLEGIVKSFDFNACMAYMSVVENDRLVFEYTSPFIQFIKERMLKIYNFHHPLSTIIRGYNKEKELKVRFDRAKVVEVIANLFGEIEIEKTFLGEKKRADLANNEDILEPWFVFDKEKGVFKSIVPESVIKNYSGNKGSDVFALFRLPVIQRERFLRLIELGYFKYYNVFDYISKNKVRIPNFNDKQAEKLSSFVKEHSFYMDPNYIREWLPLIKKLKKEKDLAFIGFCENMLNMRFFDRPQDDKKVHGQPLSIDYLKAEYKKSLEKELIELNKKIDIPEEFLSYLEEINNVRDLRLEGLEMSHCVGGYSHDVEKGNSRIFKVNFNEQRGTLELRKMHPDHSFSLNLHREERRPNDATSMVVGVIEKKSIKKTYYLSQLKSKRNEPCSVEMEEMCRKFIKVVNENLPEEPFVEENAEASEEG